MGKGTQKKGFFFGHQPGEDEGKEAGLDNFAVRMGSEDFIAEVGAEVEDDGDPDVSRIFGAKPVHDEDEVDHAHHEADAVLSAFGDKVRLISSL